MVRHERTSITAYRERDQVHTNTKHVTRYLNQNNFLRSVRNFIIDIRATPQWAQICGIHWQVAQGTSLENIHFYMTKPKDDPETTQQVSMSLHIPRTSIDGRNLRACVSVPNPFA